MIASTGDWLWTAADIRDNKNILGAQSLHILIFVHNAIHRINHYPAEKYYGNHLRQPLDGDLSGG